MKPNITVSQEQYRPVQNVGAPKVGLNVVASPTTVAAKNNDQQFQQLQRGLESLAGGLTKVTEQKHAEFIESEVEQALKDHALDPTQEPVIPADKTTYYVKTRMDAFGKVKALQVTNEIMDRYTKLKEDPEAFKNTKFEDFFWKNYKELTAGISQVDVVDSIAGRATELYGALRPAALEEQRKILEEQDLGQIHQFAVELTKNREFGFDTMAEVVEFAKTHFDIPREKAERLFLEMAQRRFDANPKDEKTMNFILQPHPVTGIPLYEMLAKDPDNKQLVDSLLNSATDVTQARIKRREAEEAAARQRAAEQLFGKGVDKVVNGGRLSDREKAQLKNLNGPLYAQYVMMEGEALQRMQEQNSIEHALQNNLVQQLDPEQQKKAQSRWNAETHYVLTPTEENQITPEQQVQYAATRVANLPHGVEPEAIQARVKDVGNISPPTDGKTLHPTQVFALGLADALEQQGKGYLIPIVFKNPNDLSWINMARMERRSTGNTSDALINMARYTSPTNAKAMGQVNLKEVTEEAASMVRGKYSENPWFGPKSSLSNQYGPLIESTVSTTATYMVGQGRANPEEIAAVAIDNLESQYVAVQMPGEKTKKLFPRGTQLVETEMLDGNGNKVLGQDGKPVTKLVPVQMDPDTQKKVITNLTTVLNKQVPGTPSRKYRVEPHMGNSNILVIYDATTNRPAIEKTKRGGGEISYNDAIPISESVNVAAQKDRKLPGSQTPGSVGVAPIYLGVPSYAGPLGVPVAPTAPTPNMDAIRLKIEAEGLEASGKRMEKDQLGASPAIPAAPKVVQEPAEDGLNKTYMKPSAEKKLNKEGLKNPKPAK